MVLEAGRCPIDLRVRRVWLALGLGAVDMMGERNAQTTRYTVPLQQTLIKNELESSTFGDCCFGERTEWGFRQAKVNMPSH
jgi:hypothetical protein